MTKPLEFLRKILLELKAFAAFFDNGYGCVSFYVESLFTVIPIERIFDVIMYRIYSDKLIST